MTSRIGFPQRFRNPDVRANIASNRELYYYEVVDICHVGNLLSVHISESYRAINVEFGVTQQSHLLTQVV